MINEYFLIIGGTILGAFVLERIAEALNLRSLRDEVPEEFADVFDSETYLRSQQYLRRTTRFHRIESTVEMTAFLGFWLAGGFGWLDDRLRATDMSVILRGVVYIGLLLVFRMLLSLPFSAYRTFVIEVEFGFNKTTPGLYVMDRIKGIGLSVVFGGPILAGVLSFFEYAGEWAWLYSWLGWTLIGLVIQYVAPTWILPWFNKYAALEEGELKQSILRVAQRVQFPLREIRVMDGSKRSTKSNAFFTGFGKNKRIALFDTLIEKHSVGELTAVVAHEMGHYKKRHILAGMLIGWAHTGLLFFLMSVFIREVELVHAFSVESVSVYAGLVFFGLLFTPVELLLGMFMNMLSRKHEYEADRFAAEATGSPEDLITGLKKLTRDNLSNLTPHPFHVFVHDTHPPVLSRMAALRKARKEFSVYA